MDDETRATQLENILRAIADHIDKYGVMYEADPVWRETEALLDGEGAPADTDPEPWTGPREVQWSGERPTLSVPDGPKIQIEYRPDV